MAERVLKIFPTYMQAIISGVKKFEVRKDEQFHVGQMLLLKEWDAGAEEYTGNEVYALVTYVMKGGKFGIQEGYCVLGIEQITREELKERRPVELPAFTEKHEQHLDQLYPKE